MRTIGVVPSKVEKHKAAIGANLKTVAGIAMPTGCDRSPET
ncbi:hypothetical protein DFP92_101370 [Yoonia sediminilitoris]|uniref:Uncharacterized protein n=1 Tax=Yoonia sediminilitoris TaxID=1286148 RepID=A0A2T6KQF2_9RHOB|nr:hypothetical protein C8N45_101370 [Yoonia sediminilitoris]RCW98951.1 hypothetical protein DFP92_101370 [Yoonia sediminilitoris]